jgi:hypothetical protein
MTEEDKKKFEGSYMRAKTVLNKINEYAGRQVELTTHAIDTPTGFETPNWQYLVAWQSGYRTAMRITQDLTRTK